MALISRRGRRRRASPTPTPSLYPPGQSLLEQLPLEILQTVFIESENEELVTVSKSIYACLGYKPCEWLYLAFLRKKCTRYAIKYTANASSHRKSHGAGHFYWEFLQSVSSSRIHAADVYRLDKILRAYSSTFGVIHFQRQLASSNLHTLSTQKMASPRQ